MKKYANTKIVATIGPASWDESVIKEMLQEGLDVARINASFADFKELDRVSSLLRNLSPNLALMLDTKGHKIRVTGFTQPKTLEKSSKVIIVPEQYIKEDNQQLPDTYLAITYPTLHNDISRNSILLLDDGNITLKVIDINDEEVHCEVISPGILNPKKTVNIPSTHLNFPTLSDKDSEDIKYAVRNDFEYISASFVRNVEDVKLIKEAMGDTDTKLIAKIEDFEGVKNFNAILNLVDGIMVARGDLGVELPLEDVPILQKQFIYKCREAGKIVIVATQMLESMKENSRPTRAEVSDVANAIMDGTDAVMLSVETSMGKYPSKSVQMMNKIALRVEDVLRPQKIEGKTEATKETDELCKNIFNMVESLSLKGVIVISKTGKTIRSLSRHRLTVPIWDISSSLKRVRQDNLIRGVQGLHIEQIPSDRDELVEKSVEMVFALGQLDLTDKIAIISGSSVNSKLTNTIAEIVTIKDVLSL
jgi:pyruvate kinase